MDFICIKNDPKLQALLADIFTDQFMQSYTTFKNFEAFQYSSAVIVNWSADEMIYSTRLLDGFVRESTQFQTWEDMVKEGTDRRFNRLKKIRSSE